MDERKLQNKNTVSIIYISWKKELDEALKNFNDLSNNIIAYAMICELERSVDDAAPTIHAIIRFHKRKSILQIKKYFPSAVLENIVSWKNIKDKMCRNALDKHLKSFEIGTDRKSKQESKIRHYEQKKKSMKRSELYSRSHIQSLDDIVELKNNPKTRTDLISHIFNRRPDLIRDRHQGIKLAKELAKEQKMKKLIIKANSVKWRDWQSWFIEKATNEEINSREILVVYDPKGNTGKSYLNTMFSLLYSDETCNLQNGFSQNMFHSAGKVNNLKYVLMDLCRSDEKCINYSAIEKIKNGNFDTCKYNNENVCVEPPFFAIFTNFKLHWWSMSLDRWSLLYIDSENDSFTFFPRYDRNMKMYFNSETKSC